LPVTADDLDQAVQLAVTTLRDAPPAAWDGKAGSLEWDCWETVEHLSDDLFAYAVQPDAPHTTDPWPTLLWATGRAELPGHPRLTTWRWYGTPGSPHPRDPARVSGDHVGR
jgi:hypothetical protein